MSADPELKVHVDWLFERAADRYATIRRNPVTGSEWLRGVDSIRPQKTKALRALHAHIRFAQTKPADVPDLPLSYDEREGLKRTYCEKCPGDPCETCGVLRILAWYARSLEAQEYD